MSARDLLRISLEFTAEHAESAENLRERLCELCDLGGEKGLFQESP